MEVINKNGTNLAWEQ